MPPATSKPLASEQIALIKRWIAEGATGQKSAAPKAAPVAVAQEPINAADARHAQRD
jgi:hypothetical protein